MKQEARHLHPGDTHNKVSPQPVTHYKHSHTSKNPPVHHPQIHTPQPPSKPLTVPLHPHPGAKIKPISTPLTSPPSAPDQVTSPTVSHPRPKVTLPPPAPAPSINNVCNRWDKEYLVDNLARMRILRLISLLRLVRMSFLR